MGIDGTGSVSSVAGVSPNADGNIPLTAENVGALPSTGGTMTGQLNMNGQKLTGLNAPVEDDEPATKGYADNLKPDLTGYATEKYVDDAAKKAARFNYLDNSNFLQFVAQSGVGGNYGSKTYAGDRWILVNGTVTGTKNENGDDWTAITLNGTIKQVLATIPDGEHVCGVEMVSGTAQIAYNNGAVTITSSGGVIKNAGLYSGAVLPEYQPKGYGAELAECQRYYMTGLGQHIIGHTAVKEDKEFFIVITTPQSMRICPTVIIEIADNVIFGTTSGYLICSVTGVKSVEKKDTGVLVVLNMEKAAPQHYATGSTFSTLLTFDANLPEGD
jgi:hypothetical protein